MATPLGHALAGGWVAAGSDRGRLDLRMAGFAGAVAVSPDLDFIPGLLIGEPSRFHHAYTHSLAAAVLVAVAVWLFARQERRVKLALLSLAAYGSHLGLDLLTLDDSAPRGMPLLWPLSSAPFDLPVHVFPNVVHHTSVLNWHNARIAAIEMVLLGVPLALVALVRHRRHGRSDGLPARSGPDGSEDGGSPVRVLLACDRLGYDNERLHGAGRLMIQWTRALAEHGVDVTTVILRRPGELGRQVIREGLPFVFLSRHPYDPRTLIDFVRIVREREIEVLHLQAFGASTFGRVAGLLTGVPAIVHVHADYRGEPKGYPLHVKLADRLLARLTTKVFAISEPIAAFAAEEQGFQPSDVEVIHPTVDLEDFTPSDPPRRNAARRAVGVPEGAPTAGCVARFHRIKGVDILVEAWATVVRTLPDAHLLLIGDGPDRPMLEGLISDSGLAGRVHLLGYREDVEELLCACDLVVLPSRMEGLGLAALEAMAVGIPVVGSRVGGIPEVVEEGRNGFLARPEDPEDLAATLCRAFDAVRDDPARYRQGALAVAREHGLSSFAEKMDEVYRSLGRPRRRAIDGSRGPTVHTGTDERHRAERPVGREPR